MSNGGGGGFTISQIIMWCLVIAIAGFVYLRFFNKGGNGDFTHIPKEVLVNYVPSDFNPTIDEENALAVISNPHRYEKEFNELIFQFNNSLLQHVTNRMNLPDTVKSAVFKEYRKQHPAIKEMYYNDFIAMFDTSGAEVQTWYGNQKTNAVELLKEVASRYTCFMVNLVLSSAMKTEAGRIYIRGQKADTPCGVAVNESLAPMMARLQKRAEIDDFSRSKNFIQERVEKTIAELATFEIRDKKGLSRQMQTKLLGMEVSSTQLEVSAISVIKVGFNLKNKFSIDLNPKSNKLIVNMPSPTILSHEVFPRMDKLDIGWLREVSNQDFNKNFNLLREEFRRDALDGDAMGKAKNEATVLMETMLGPLAASYSKKYTVEVRFDGSTAQ